MKKVLILANNAGGLYRFRKELIYELINQKYEVYVSAPQKEVLEELEELEEKGVKVLHTNIDRRGINPLIDSKLLMDYIKIIKSIKPDLVLTYTIKPNIYGGLVSRLTRTPYIINITGLGTAFQGNGILKKLIVNLYKVALKKVKKVLFENEGNKQIFISNNIIPEGIAAVMNGAGVNLNEYPFEIYPDNKMIRFLFIGRVMKEKGIEELLWAADKIKQEYDYVTFDIVGSLEENYKSRLEELSERGTIRYHGVQKDVRPFITNCHCVVLPSYHEGMSNTLLEAASMGRPLIASDIYGCKEVIRDNGYLLQVKNKNSLYIQIKEFINDDQISRVEKGINSRKLVEEKFDKRLVVQNTINYIDLAMKGNEECLK